MNVNLTDVMVYDGFTKSFELDMELPKVDFYETVYKLTKPISGELKLTNVGGKEIILVGDYTLAFEMPCSRCLKPVLSELTGHIEKHFSMDKDKVLSEEEEEDNQFLNGYMLEVDRMICDDIFMNLPLQILCDEDCQGLCPVCGTDLNHTSCGCDKTNIDPRMEQFRDLLGKF